MTGQRKFIPGKYDVDPIIKRLIEERTSRNLSRNAVAEACFSTKTRIQGWEVGAFRPRIDLLRLWAYVLGFSLEPVPVRYVPAVRAFIQNLSEEENK